MFSNNNLHRTREEGIAQEENEEEEEETYDDDDNEEDDQVDDDSEEIPDLVPRDEIDSDSGDDTENETDEDTEDEIRVRALPNMVPLPLMQLVNIYQDKYERNEDETRSIYEGVENEVETRSTSTSTETVEMPRNINGWTIGNVSDRYFRADHESSSSELNQVSYGRNIVSSQFPTLGRSHAAFERRLRALRRRMGLTHREYVQMIQYYLDNPELIHRWEEQNSHDDDRNE